MQRIPDADIQKPIEADCRKMTEEGILLGEAEPSPISCSVAATCTSEQTKD
jgi:hypothetical protein